MRANENISLRQESSAFAQKPKHNLIDDFFWEFEMLGANPLLPEDLLCYSVRALIFMSVPMAVLANAAAVPRALAAAVAAMCPC